MKLARTQIETLSRLILNRLKARGLATFKADEETVFEKVVGVITDDLRAEDALDREVESILDAHAKTPGAENVDHRKMFNMIKHKLARERNMVL